MQNHSLSKRLWFVLILFGLVGQIAWSVENIYFNLFIYNTISKSTSSVTLMVQLSGIVATVTTLFAGILSDKLGNRKYFVSVGYLCWGLLTLSFAFVTKENTQIWFGLTEELEIIQLTIAIVITLDCIMTAFGSTANDAAFNAYVTDNTGNARSLAEGVLSAMPLIAMLIVAGGFGIIVTTLGYPGLFVGVGTLMSLSGIIGLWLINDNPNLKKSNSDFISDLLYGFRVSVIKKNRQLYLYFLAMGIYGIASQIYMPYLIIFMQEYLHFDAIQYSVVFACVILGASVIAIFLGNRFDGKNKDRLLMLFSIIYIVGMLSLYITAKTTAGININLVMVLVGITSLILMTGFVQILALLGAQIRDYTPAENIGKLQGIRMIFFVLIPMFIGPMIGQKINETTNLTYVDPINGSLAHVPSPEIFLTSGIFCVFIFYPLILLKRK
ncbi:transporter, major facilitator family protein [Leptospira yanagawae serovar Saopaulo str. Sao Paulo = ATCC 700523]|uniref:Transporter, major facilitator family protein n=1 Tax=Leptospira yanagawae serovar Saopaulo str. Sao Paulo = ATCC 700523 TaxID=1249483 RepID=A0A5E8HBK2_9LEPT|nr:transporter, major facilitator family protein [Leptospira yanagawae serovar Saopaulo str. Sao Paulo = ATCC 700523]